MSQTKYLDYRGDISASAVFEQQLIFSTFHQESQATALYYLDAQSYQLEKTELSVSVLDLTTHKTDKGLQLSFIGSDNTIYQTLYKAQGKTSKPKALASISELPVIALLSLTDNQLLLAQSKQLTVLDAKGKVQQVIDLDTPICKAAVSDDAAHIVVGDQSGFVSAYELADNTYQLSSKEQLHKGEVTSLIFEAEKHSFFSAATDNQLLTSHAKGKLQAINRGKSLNHQETIRDISLGQERFFTGADDKTVKSWPLSGGQPATFKEDLHKTKWLQHLHFGNHNLLAVFGLDNSIRIISLDAADKFSSLECKIYDAYNLRKNELKQSEVSIRENALLQLAAFDDKKSIAIISAQIAQKNDLLFDELCINTLIKSKHIDSYTQLEAQLKHKNEKIRNIAFKGLLKKTADSNEAQYQLLANNINSQYADLAICVLTQLQLQAQTHQASRFLIEQSLEHKIAEVRMFSLSSLEQVYQALHGENKPDANLLAVKSKFEDVRRAGLIRLFQRGLIQEPNVKNSVQNAVRRCFEDSSHEINHTACLISLFFDPELAAVTRFKDEELHRQLFELENYQLLSDGKAESKKTKKLTKAKKVSLELTEQQKQPLLHAMASRNNDSSLFGATTLALIGDQRAFILLMQLSQSSQVASRLAVAKAFATQGNQRVLKQLQRMLSDKEQAVRDTAFDSLQQLEKSVETLVTHALNSEFQDIHLRALKLLLDNLSAKAGGKIKASLLAVLTKALNDPFEAVRQQVFKSCLNQQLAGDAESSLKLLLSSVYQDVHQLVFEELEAKLSKKRDLPWALQLLWQLFNDEFKATRASAFEFAVAQFKKDITPLTFAVKAQFVDVRLLALQQLTKQPTKEKQNLLLELLDDENRDLRQQVLATLIKHNASDALTNALNSEFIDIRVEAAKACARMGNEKALPELLRLAKQAAPQDQQSSAFKQWLSTTKVAIEGLIELADTTAFELLFNFVNCEYESLASAAGKGLMWVADPSHSHSQQLQTLLKHDNKTVKQYAALALCYLGDESAYSLLPAPRKSQLSTHEQLIALHSLNKVDNYTVRAFYDDPDSYRAMWVLLLIKQWKQEGESELLLNSLSDDNLSQRLHSADALQHFYQPDFANYILEVINERVKYDAHAKDWNIDRATLDTLTAGLLGDDRKLKARSLQLLLDLSQTQEKSWLLNYQQLQARYDYQAPATIEPTVIEVDLDELQQYLFGTYVGVLRLNSDEHYNRSSFNSLRLHALDKVIGLAQDEKLNLSINNFYLQLLSDPLSEIRLLAFEASQLANFNHQLLGEQALQSGYSDVGALGLTLLTQSNDGKLSETSLRLLSDLMVQGDDDLVYKAKERLLSFIGIVKTAELALDAKQASLRKQAIFELAELFNPDSDSSASKAELKQAEQLLLSACDSERFDLALEAAARLQAMPHKNATDILHKLLLKQTSSRHIAQVLNIFKRNKDPQVSTLLLQYLQDSKAILTSDLYKQLLAIIADFRQSAQSATLIELFAQESVQKAGKKSDKLKPLFNAILTINGFTQPIDLTAEARGDHSWQLEQHKRTPEPLLSLLETVALIESYIPVLKSGLCLVDGKVGKQIDALIEKISPTVSDSDFTHLLSICAWRLRYRDGAKRLLTDSLNHSDMVVRFTAAEALALAKQTEGIATLLATIDYDDELRHRLRAVTALGKLADVSALDKLLSLASEQDHALQAKAIEAIGHMGQSEQQDKIFSLLKQPLKADAEQYDRDMTKAALNGLRYFNSQAAWALIYDHACDENIDEYQRRDSVALLGYKDTPAHRSLLLALVEQDHYYVDDAYQSALKFWPISENHASDLDIVYMNTNEYGSEAALKRVCQFASVEQLFTALSQSDDSEIQQTLMNSLLLKDQIDEAVLISNLQSPFLLNVQLAAQLVGRQSTISSKQKTELAKQLTLKLQDWSEQAHLQSLNLSTENLEETLSCLETLIWSNARFELAQTELLSIVENENFPLALRQDGLKQLLNAQQCSKKPAKLSKAFSELLTHLSAHPDVILRQVALDFVALQQDTSSSAQPIKALIEQLQQSSKLSQTIATMITEQQVETLSLLAQDQSLALNLRSLVIEALAKINSDDALKQLQQLLATFKQALETDSKTKLNADDKEVMETLRNLCFRSLRRLQRQLDKNNKLSQLMEAQVNV